MTFSAETIQETQHSKDKIISQETHCDLWDWKVKIIRI